MRLWCAALALVTSIVPVYAESGFTGSSLDKSCRDIAFQRSTGTWQDGFDQGACLGVVHTLLMISGVELPSEFRFCAPSNATVQQGLRVLVKRLDDHPEELHKPVPVIALRAFHVAWPCQK